MPDKRTLEETERVTEARVEHLPLDLTAAHALSSMFRAANAVRAHLTRDVLRPHDLTWRGFLVLWTLWIWQDMEIGEVADSVDISKTTMTGVSKTLVSRGLVRRTVLSTDRRLVHLTLTPSGLQLMERLYPEFNATEAKVVADLSPGEVETITIGLRRIVETTRRLAGAPP